MALDTKKLLESSACTMLGPRGVAEGPSVASPGCLGKPSFIPCVWRTLGMFQQLHGRENPQKEPLKLLETNQNPKTFQQKMLQELLCPRRAGGES